MTSHPDTKIDCSKVYVKKSTFSNDETGDFDGAFAAVAIKEGECVLESVRPPCSSNAPPLVPADILNGDPRLRYTCTELLRSSAFRSHRYRGDVAVPLGIPSQHGKKHMNHRVTLRFGAKESSLIKQQYRTTSFSVPRYSSS